MNDHTGRRWECSPQFDRGGPLIFTASLFGGPLQPPESTESSAGYKDQVDWGEAVLASLWWCLRFNRWTTAAVMDGEARQIVFTGMTSPLLIRNKSRGLSLGFRLLWMLSGMPHIKHCQTLWEPTREFHLKPVLQLCIIPPPRHLSLNYPLRPKIVLYQSCLFLLRDHKHVWVFLWVKSLETPNCYHCLLCPEARCVQ